MILRQDDWANYPSAIADYESKNKSFVRLATLFHMMGIKNNNFMLALHNPELVGVDPFSPDLTQEQMAMIVEECIENFWYVIREIIKLPPNSGRSDIPFKANRANICLYWLYFQHIAVLLIQPRQTGKSVSTDVLWVVLFSIMTTDMEISLLTKDDSLRVKNVERIKGIYAQLPFYLQFKLKTDTWNTELLKISALNNTYSTLVAQPSPVNALKVGRGMTLPNNHVDELAFISNIDITLPAMLAASTAARENAKVANAPYGNIFTTTAGYLYTKSGKYAHAIYKNSMRWSDKLLDTPTAEELLDLLQLSSGKGNRVMLLEYNHRQLGYTDKEFKDIMDENMADPISGQAEYMNIWISGSDASPIDKKYLDIINASKDTNPKIEIYKYGYTLRWYVDPESVKNRNIVAGIDTSNATGGDDMSLVMRDVSTGELLAIGDYNETNLIIFSDWLGELIVKYPNIVMIIENRSTGQAIIDNLLKILPLLNIDPFKVLFNWVVNDYDVYENYRKYVIDLPMFKRPSWVYEKYRGEFGYATSGSGRAARDNLYSVAFNHSIKYTSNTVRDGKLIAQLLSLTIKNNRIDHGDGPDDHDDLVIGWLLCYYFLLSAKNKSYYGIPSNSVLSTVQNLMLAEKGGAEEVEKKEKQMALKETIDNLLVSMKEKNDPIYSRLTELKVRRLYNYVDHSIIPAYNIESLLDNIKIEQQKSGFKHIKYYAA